MKKSYILIAAATILVACTKNDKFTEDSEPQLIGFSKVYIEKGTKAFQTGAYDMNNFETAGNTFGVFGYKDATSNNMKVFGERTGEEEGVKVTFGTDWTYSPLRYWDKAASAYHFYAYAPHSDNFEGTASLASNSQNAFSISGFKQATTQSAMIDLMTDLTSKATVNSTTTKPLGQNDVDFTFKHILSNINIRMAVGADLKADKANNPVTVTSVSVGAIKMDGSYAYNEGYKWTLAATPTTQTFPATEQSTGIVFAADELKAIENTAANSLDASDVDTKATAVAGLTDLLFVPQAVIDDYVINVTYKIQNEVFSKTIKLNAFLKTTDNTSVLSTWEPGYKYTYILVIGPTPILFDVADITGWTDGGTYLYNIN